MTTTEQNDIIAAFEAYAAGLAMGCCLDKYDEPGLCGPVYADNLTETLYRLYRAGYAQARCCYGMVAPE